MTPLLNDTYVMVLDSDGEFAYSGYIRKLVLEGLSPDGVLPPYYMVEPDEGYGLDLVMHVPFNLVEDWGLSGEQVMASE